MASVAAVMHQFDLCVGAVARLGARSGIRFSCRRFAFVVQLIQTKRAIKSVGLSGLFFDSPRSRFGRHLHRYRLFGFLSFLDFRIVGGGYFCGRFGCRFGTRLESAIAASRMSDSVLPLLVSNDWVVSVIFFSVFFEGIRSGRLADT